MRWAAILMVASALTSGVFGLQCKQCSKGEKCKMAVKDSCIPDWKEKIIKKLTTLGGVEAQLQRLFAGKATHCLEVVEEEKLIYGSCVGFDETKLDDLIPHTLPKEKLEKLLKDKTLDIEWPVNEELTVQMIPPIPTMELSFLTATTKEPETTTTKKPTPLKTIKCKQCTKGKCKKATKKKCVDGPDAKGWHAELQLATKDVQGAKELLEVMPKVAKDCIEVRNKESEVIFGTCIAPVTEEELPEDGLMDGAVTKSDLVQILQKSPTQITLVKDIRKLNVNLQKPLEAFKCFQCKTKVECSSNKKSESCGEDWKQTLKDKVQDKKISALIELEIPDDANSCLEVKEDKKTVFASCFAKPSNATATWKYHEARLKKYLDKENFDNLMKDQRVTIKPPSMHQASTSNGIIEPVEHQVQLCSKEGCNVPNTWQCFQCKNAEDCKKAKYESKCETAKWKDVLKDTIPDDTIDVLVMDTIPPAADSCFEVKQDNNTVFASCVSKPSSPTAWWTAHKEDVKKFISKENFENLYKADKNAEFDYQNKTYQAEICTEEEGCNKPDVVPVAGGIPLASSVLLTLVLTAVVVNIL